MGASNVIVIVFDAMRRDELAIYGGKSTTPNIDKFCYDSVAYPNCIAPSPWTVPSHASIFSGKFSCEHGVHVSQQTKGLAALALMQNTMGETLAEGFGKRGYQTVGISGNSLLTTVKGFDRGFESFETCGPHFEEGMGTMWEAMDSGKTRSQLITQYLSQGKVRQLWRLYQANKKMQQQRKLLGYPLGKGGDLIAERLERPQSLREPFFLFLNMFEMHDPYVPFEMRRKEFAPFRSIQLADMFGFRKITDDEVAILRAGYSRAAARLDVAFGRIISTLKSRGFYDDSVIVVTADHGQAFEEHGYYTHGTFLYDEILEVPLIVKYPKERKPAHRPGYQSSVGIFELVKAASEGGDSERLTEEETFSESFGSHMNPPEVSDMKERESFDRVRMKVDRHRKAVYRDGYKLVLDWETREVEEFTHDKSPLSKSEEPEVLKGLQESLDRFAKRTAAPPVPVSLTPEEEADFTERLQALGYA